MPRRGQPGTEPKTPLRPPGKDCCTRRCRVGVARPWRTGGDPITGAPWPGTVLSCTGTPAAGVQHGANRASMHVPKVLSGREHWDRTFLTILGTPRPSPRACCQGHQGGGNSGGTERRSPEREGAWYRWGRSYRQGQASRGVVTLGHTDNTPSPQSEAHSGRESESHGSLDCHANCDQQGGTISCIAAVLGGTHEVKLCSLEISWSISL